MKVITKVAPRNPSLQRYFNQKFRQHFRRYIKAKEKKVKWAIDAYLTLMYGLTSYVILKSFEPREDSDRIADIFIDELFAHVLVHNKPVISSYIASIANNSLQLISEKALGELLRALRRHTSDIRRDHELTLSSFIESNLHEKIIKEHIRILRKYTGVDYSHLFEDYENTLLRFFNTHDELEIPKDVKSTSDKSQLSTLVRTPDTKTVSVQASNYNSVEPDVDEYIKPSIEKDASDKLIPFYTFHAENMENYSELDKGMIIFSTLPDLEIFLKKFKHNFSNIVKLYKVYLPMFEPKEHAILYYDGIKNPVYRSKNVISGVHYDYLKSISMLTDKPLTVPDNIENDIEAVSYPVSMEILKSISADLKSIQKTLPKDPKDISISKATLLTSLHDRIKSLSINYTDNKKVREFVKKKKELEAYINEILRPYRSKSLEAKRPEEVPLDIWIKDNYTTYVERTLKDDILRYLNFTLPTGHEIKTTNLHYKHIISEESALENGTSYTATLRGTVTIQNPDKTSITQTIDILDVPLMTSRGTFIRNGLEYVVPLYVGRTAGVYFSKKGFIAEAIFRFETKMAKWSWVQIEFNTSDRMFDVKFDMYAKGRSVKKEPFYIDNISEIPLVVSSFESYDPKLYERPLGERGRKICNQILGLDEKSLTLTKNDIIAAMKKLYLEHQLITEDDQDQLYAKRLKPPAELLQFNLERYGLKNIQSLSAGAARRNPKPKKVQDILQLQQLKFNSSKNFLNEYAQYAKQTNPFAELEHKRRVNSEFKNTEGRNIVESQYGVICPIYTSEGGTVGLNNHLALNAKIGPDWSTYVPYFKLSKGKIVSNKPVWLEPIEAFKYKIAESVDGFKPNDMVQVRYKNQYIRVPLKEVQYVQYQRGQSLSIGALMTPFASHDDGKRLLMAANYTSQAVPLKYPEVPLVQTGLEARVARDSGYCVISTVDGTVIKVTNNYIKVKEASTGIIVAYKLANNRATNSKTSYSHIPLVSLGDKVKKDQILADGPAIKNGVMALGRNLLTAFMLWESYTYDDGIVISSRLVDEDILTSVKVVPVRVEFAPEDKILKDQKYAWLDEHGVVKKGSRVSKGSIIVNRYQANPEDVDDSTLGAIYMLGSMLDKKSRYRAVPINSPVDGDVTDVVKSYDDRGFLTRVEIHIAEERKIEIGDKLANRHGNKGVVCKIVDEKNMPQLKDGRRIDIILTPLGIPSRMNPGQLLEMMTANVAYKKGKPITVPLYYGYEPKYVESLAESNGFNKSGTMELFDPKGVSLGEHAVGYMYVYKLEHYSADKEYGRSVGKYSTLTGQPLGGKINQGGQAIGEMTTWAYMAHGTPDLLREITSVKSDNLKGKQLVLRKLAANQPVYLNEVLEGSSESLKRAAQLLKSAHIDVTFSDKKGNAVDLDTRKGEIDHMSIKLLSKSEILRLSKGEVTSPESINQKTASRYPGGLFDPDIFGSERMPIEEQQKRYGHIKLNVPVVNPWAKKGKLLHYLTGIPEAKLKKLMKYQAYLKYKLDSKGLIDEFDIVDERDILDKEYLYVPGVEGLKIFLDKFDLNEELRKLKASKDPNPFRLDLLTSLKTNKSDLYKNLIMDVILVPPQTMRPASIRGDGKVDIDPLNELYQNIIKQNNRLGLLQKTGLSHADIFYNEAKYRVQDAVDKLFDNANTEYPLTQKYSGLPLKSLMDYVTGKEGFLRSTLLKKRIDYSARGVITVAPDLGLDEIGLPVEISMEIFQFHILGYLLDKKGYSYTEANYRLQNYREYPEIIEILKEIMKDKLVIATREPVLHKFNVQAFRPILNEGDFSSRAIRVNPLICSSYNADFDGDQMSVHLPITVEGQKDAELLLPSNNLFDPSTGSLAHKPEKDIIISMYLMSKEKKTKGVLKKFSFTYEDFNKILNMFEEGKLDLAEQVMLKYGSDTIITTPGKILFNAILPKYLQYANKEITKSSVAQMVETVYKKEGSEAAAKFLNQLKNFGSQFVHYMGFTLSWGDYVDIPEKADIVDKAQKEYDKLQEMYNANKISYDEFINRYVAIWESAKSKIKSIIDDRLKKDKNGRNNLLASIKSGARGSIGQAMSVIGIRGLMQKPNGDYVLLPVSKGMREGLTEFQYFSAASGARKGLVDTGTKMGDAGYFGRKLINVAHDVVITLEDCGTSRGTLITALNYEDEGTRNTVDLATRLLGRTLAREILVNSKVIAKRNQLVDSEVQKLIKEYNVKEAVIRSPLTCESTYGICAKCYGMDLGSLKESYVGLPVGILAGQSLQEDTSQGTMRTMHTGGVAGSVSVGESKVIYKEPVEVVDITAKIENGVALSHGFIKVRTSSGAIDTFEVFGGTKIFVSKGSKVKEGVPLVERDPYNMAVVSPISGLLKILNNVAVVSDGKNNYSFPIPNTGTVIKVNLKDGTRVRKGDILFKIPFGAIKAEDVTNALRDLERLFNATKPNFKCYLAESSGEVSINPLRRNSIQLTITDRKVGSSTVQVIPRNRVLYVTDGDIVEKGQQLTNGELWSVDIARTRGPEAAELFLRDKAREIYASIGSAKMNDKHIEIIIRQMMNTVIVDDPGDTNFRKGQLVQLQKVREANEMVMRPATYTKTIRGIDETAKNYPSFMSSASHRESAHMFLRHAILGSVDELRGLKENMMVGNKIPVRRIKSK